MENHFLVDSEFLSPQALSRKHQLETDPSSRKSHMEYLPGMEQLQSDIRDKVIGQMESYDPARYTARDVRAALDHVVFVGDVSRTGQIADALREANDKAYVF